MKTAESVLLGHPDKACDLIADALLDEYLKQDPYSRVAIEVQGGHGVINIIGEVTSKAQIDIENIVKYVLKDIGYDPDIEIWHEIVQQSTEIAQGVDKGGAGDSGIVIGYYTDETPEGLPKELAFARRITTYFDSRFLPAFGPDGKVQVTVNEEGQITHIVASIQHNNPLEDARQQIETIIREILGKEMHPMCQLHINPAGDFTIGGFEADTGATGRKIVQDQYGPSIPVGGGAFSGKDATKVDRSGAYWARKRAREIVQENGEQSALVKLVWAIGEPYPIVVEPELSYTLSVEEIIDQLDLRKPNFYQRTKRHHYGIDL